MITPNEDQIVLENENGEEVAFDVLHSFYSDELEKGYVLLVEAGDESGDVFAYAVVPDETGEGGELVEITTDEEWEMIEEVLATLEDLDISMQ